MLAIGLPMFLRISLRLSKKVPLVGIFSLGVFVIIAAILNKVYSFSDPFSDQWVYWYVRESSTALIVANLPFVWLFYRKLFRIRSSTASRNRYGSTPHTATRISSMRRRSVKGSPDVPGARKDSDPSDATLELGGMGEAGLWSDNMTAEEMLRGDVLSSAHAKNATPFTHPALFYANGARKPLVPPVPDLPEQAVLSDYGEQQTLRRGSSPDLRFNGTPVSSNFTDGGTGPKAGSFV